MLPDHLLADYTLAILSLSVAFPDRIDIALSVVLRKYDDPVIIDGAIRDGAWYLNDGGQCWQSIAGADIDSLTARGQRSLERNRVGGVVTLDHGAAER